MIDIVIDLGASIAASMLVMLVPGAALIGVLRVGNMLPALLLPAASVIGTILLTAPLLALTLLMHQSIVALALMLGIVTAVLLIVLLNQRIAAPNGPSLPVRLRPALPYLPPGLLLTILGIFDAPQVRSDTYWHVALARKLSELDGLSSMRIAFEAGSAGNANYPLPVWHALIALADQVPRVDVWSITWFMTLWLAPVAMLAFAGMAGALTGDARAMPIGAWVFTTIVVLGYGPWFMATRYLSYPGQVAIYLALPLTVWLFVRTLDTEEKGARLTLLALLASSTISVGILHGNYVLYSVLLGAGATALMFLGGVERVRRALVASGVIIGAGAATIAMQIPWIRNDDNFMRAGKAPLGEPSAFLRHRDVFSGTESMFHVDVGSLAAQPWLVAGALALPVLLIVMRRYLGPWVLAGWAAAIVLCARAPQFIELLDHAGSVTPATRFDRIYPAAIGVVAIMLAIGWALARTWKSHGRLLGITASSVTAIVLALGTFWIDSLRDTRRVVTTPYVEARWVGGLPIAGIPRIAVMVSTAAILLVALGIRIHKRRKYTSLASSTAAQPDRRHQLALLATVAITIGLAPASISRASATWQPQAFDRKARNDQSFTRIEIYPARTRRAIRNIRPDSTVLASFTEIRKIASLTAVKGVEESQLRAIENADPALVTRGVDYVVARVDDAEFSQIVSYVRQCDWREQHVGNIQIFVRSSTARC